MSDPGSKTLLVKSLVAITNEMNQRDIITNDNFQVLNVRPLLDETGAVNTIVHIRVDLYPDVNLPLDDRYRYDTRSVVVKRLDLEQAIRTAGGGFNSLRRHIVDSVNTKEDVIRALAPLLHIDPDEVTYRIIQEDLAVMYAKSDSLGYTGHVTVSTFDIDNPFPVLKTITIEGPKTVRYGQPVTYTSTWTEEDYVPKSVKWSVRGADVHGVYINEDTGLLYVDPDVYYQDFLVVCTIDDKEATYGVQILEDDAEAIEPTSIQIQGNNLMHPGEEMLPTLIVRPDGAYVLPRYPVWSVVSDKTLEGISVDSKTGRITVADDAVETTFTLVAIVNELIATLEINVVLDSVENPELKKVVIRGKDHLSYGDISQYDLAFRDPNYVPKEPVVWEVDRSEISQTGELTAYDSGIHVIKATVDGMVAYLAVTVDEPVMQIDELTITGPDEVRMYETGQYKYTISPFDYQPKYIRWSLDRKGNTVDYWWNSSSFVNKDVDGEVVMTLRIDKTVVTKTIKLVPPAVTAVVLDDPLPGQPIEHLESRQFTYHLEPGEAVEQPKNPMWVVDDHPGLTIDQNGLVHIDAIQANVPRFNVYLYYDDYNDPTKRVFSKREVIVSQRLHALELILPEQVEAYSDTYIQIIPTPGFITVTDTKFTIDPPISQASVVNNQLILNYAPYETVLTVTVTMGDMSASDTTFVKYPDLQSIAIPGNNYVIAGDDYPLSVIAVPTDARLPTTELVYSLVDPVPEGVTLDLENKVIHTTKEYWGKTINVKAEFVDTAFSTTKAITINERVLTGMTLIAQPLTRDITSDPVDIIEIPTNADYLGGTWGLIPTEAGTVDEYGKVTVTSPLVTEVTIKYTAPNGVVGQVTTSVAQPLISIDVAAVPDYLQNLQRQRLIYSLYPPAAVDTKDGVWAITTGAEYATIEDGYIQVNDAVNQTVGISYTQQGITGTREYVIQPIPLESINLTSADPKLTRGVPTQLTVEYVPANATLIGPAVWDFNIASELVTLDENNVLTVNSTDVKTFTATITRDGKSASITLDVSQPPLSVQVASYPPNPDDNTVVTLELIVDPPNADVDPITWSIVESQPNTELLEGARLKLVSEGGNTVKVAVSANGTPGTGDILVKEIVPTAIQIAPWSLEPVVRDKARRLDLIWTPDTTSHKEGTWAIVPPTAGTINGNIFTPNGSEISVGLEFTHTSTGMKATGTIPVINPVEDVIINLPDTIQDFTEFTPSYSLVPSNATPEEPPTMRVVGPVEMESRPDGIYYLNGVSKGYVRVEVYVDGEVYSKQAKIVPRLPDTITILNLPEGVTEGDQFQLAVEYTPELVSDPNVYWTSYPWPVIQADNTGLVNVVADSTDDNVAVTVYVGPASKTEWLPVIPKRNWNHAFTPVAVNDPVLVAALKENSLIPEKYTNPISQGFMTSQTEGYNAELIFGLNPDNEIGFTFRIPQDVWEIVSLAENTGIAMFSVSLNGGAATSFTGGQITSSSVQIGDKHYFYVDKSVYPRATGIMNVVASDKVSPYTDNYNINFSVIKLQPSAITPKWFTASQLNQLTTLGLIDSKMTGKSLGPIVGDINGYQLEVELPRRGVDDYMVFALHFSPEARAIVEQTATLMPTYTLFETKDEIITAQQVVSQSLKDDTGMYFPAKIYRFTPSLEVRNYLTDFDITKRVYDSYNNLITIVRKLEGWKPGEGRVLKIYPANANDTIIKAGQTANKLTTNVVKTARVSQGTENDKWVVDAFYPTNERSRNIVLAWIVPDSTLDELNKLVAEGDAFVGVKIYENTDLKAQYTAQGFIDRLFYVDNTPYFTYPHVYNPYPISVDVVIDFDAENEYYYETFKTTTLIRFDTAEKSSMPPVVPPAWVLLEWSLSPNKTSRYNSEVQPTLTGLTYRANFPYSDKAQSTLLAFQLSKDTFNRISALDPQTNVIRTISGGIAQIMNRDETLSRILYQNDEYYFVDEAIALGSNAKYSYRYDWDGENMEREVGNTEVYFNYTIDPKPIDPTIVSRFVPIQITTDIKNAAALNISLDIKVEVIKNSDDDYTVRTTSPYISDPALQPRYGFAIQIDEKSFTALKTTATERPNDMVYRTRRVIGSGDDAQASIRELSASAFLSDPGTLSMYNRGYRFFEFSYGETLPMIEYDLDWDGTASDYRSNTVKITHVSLITAPPKPSFWVDKSTDSAIYSRIVSLVQANYGGAANMVNFFEFGENVVMSTSQVSDDEYQTTFVANALAPSTRYYAPIPLIIDTETYNVIMALYSVVDNRSLVIGSVFDSRTTITRQFTLGQFVEQYVINDTSSRRFYYNNVVNIGGEAINYFQLLTFDFDIGGYVFKTMRHRVTIQSSVLTDYENFLVYRNV